MFTYLFRLRHLDSFGPFGGVENFISEAKSCLTVPPLPDRTKLANI